MGSSLARRLRAALAEPGARAGRRRLLGLRGQRVKNIVRELNNEKVDIIKWDSNVRNFVTNALSPAKLKNFETDEARKRGLTARKAPAQSAAGVPPRARARTITAAIQSRKNRREVQVYSAGVPTDRKTVPSSAVRCGFNVPS